MQKWFIDGISFRHILGNKKGKAERRIMVIMGFEPAPLQTSI
jgi:hypothetical protein